MIQHQQQMDVYTFTQHNIKILKPVLGGMLCTFTFITVFLYVGYAEARSRAIAATLTIKNCLQLSFRIPLQTGDLVLAQYKNCGLIQYDGLQNIPLHVGMIWMINNEAFVIEVTRFKYPYLKDYLFDRNEHENGVRVVKYTDLVNSIDGFLAIRHVLAGNVNVVKLWNIMCIQNEWIHQLKFNPAVSMRMSFLELMSIGFGPAYPNFGKVCARIAGLSKKSSNVFCSEFLSMLLQKLGHINKNFDEHWSIAPASFLKAANSIDQLSKFSHNPLYWSTEIPVVCHGSNY